MADRTRYLLVYDIREPRRLRRVHKVAKDFGYPLQYSVFVCDLSAIELISLKRALSTEIDHAADSIGVFDLGEPHGRALRCVDYLGTRREVPTADEAEIW